VAVFILTWNPSRWTITDDEYEANVQASLDGEDRPGRWSVGSRRGGISLGDQAVLLRQHEDRGIVAAGHFTTNVYQDEHWEQSHAEANFADVMWTIWLPVDDRLPVEVLKVRVPGVSWDRLQGSGVMLRADDAVALDDVWVEHLREVGRDVAAGPDRS
jgi:hypothetical protein